MSTLSSHLKASTAFYLGIGFLLVFLLANLFPEPLWAVHDSYFLPQPLRFILWIIILLGLGFAFYSTKKEPKLRISNRFAFPLNLSIWLLALLAGLCFYSFPIIDDYYGDARIFRPILHEPVSRLPEDFWSRLFSISFQPEHGRKGVRLLLSGIAYLTGSSMYEVFRWMGMLCGIGFVLTWLFAVRHFIQRQAWRIALAVIGLSTPVLLIFFGHIENYSLIYWLFLSWLLLFLYQLKHAHKRLYVLLMVLLIIFARFHIMFLLCMPGLLLAGLYTFFPDKSVSRHLLSVKGMLSSLFLPLSIVGLILYFWVFEDYHDPRVMQDFSDIDRLFLPLISPEAPYDRYNLLSFNHLLDFANAVFLWSPGCLFVVSWIWLKVPLPKWQKDPIWAILGITFLLFLATFFMINPLFSMPMEWDLMCFPAPVLLVSTLYLVSKIQQKKMPVSLLIVPCLLALFTLSSIYVNHHTKPLSQKIERIGRHVYKTYYAHSSTYLLFALNLDGQEYAARKAAIIDDLESLALPGKDQEYANLLMDEAMMYFSAQNIGGAEMMMQESLRYYPPIKERFRDFIQAVEQAQP